MAVSLTPKEDTKDVRKSLDANADVLSEEKGIRCCTDSVNSESEKRIECDLELKSSSPQCEVIIDKTVNSRQIASRIEECTLSNSEKPEEFKKKTDKEDKEKLIEKESLSAKVTEKSDEIKSLGLSLNDQTSIKERTPKLESPTEAKFKIQKDEISRNEENILPFVDEFKSPGLSSKGKSFSKENTSRSESPIRAKLVSKDSSLKSHPDRVSSPSNEIPADGIKSPGLSTKDRSFSKESTPGLKSPVKKKLFSKDSCTRSPELFVKSVSPSEKTSETKIKSPEPLVSSLRKNKFSEEDTSNLESPSRSKFTFKDNSEKSQVEKVTSPSTDGTKSPGLSVRDKPFIKERTPVLGSHRTKQKLTKNSSHITPKEKVVFPSSEISADAIDCLTPQNNTEANSEIDFWSEIKSQETMDNSEKIKSKPLELKEVLRTATIIKRAEPVIPVEETEDSKGITEACDQKADINKETTNNKSLEISNQTAEGFEKKSEDKMETNTINKKIYKPLEPLDLSRIRQSSDSIESPAVSHSLSEISTPLSEVSFSSLSEVQKRISTDTSIQDEDDGMATPTNESITKMKKWNNQDNLSNFNNLEKELTPSSVKKLISSTTSSPADSKKKKKKIVKRKKSSTKSDKNETNSVKPSSKLSNKSGSTLDSTTKMSNARSSPRDAPCRPSDLIRIFYTTPRQLLTATPRDLRKVRRAKVKKRKPPPSNASVSSDSTGSTNSTQSTTTSTEDGSNSMDEMEQKRMASTRSNDSGFDGSPRLSSTYFIYDTNCYVFSSFNAHFAFCISMIV